MSQRRSDRPCRGLAASGLLAVAVSSFLATVAAGAQEAEPVAVVNFPAVQTVDGVVEVPGPVSHTRFLAGDEVLVPPVARSEATQLIAGPELDVAGFTRVVVSLAGEVKGQVIESGKVGAVLLPAEKRVLEALREEGRFLFPLEVQAAVEPGTVYPASDPTEHGLAFPRYRVFFYNSSDRTVGVELFVYATH